MTTDGRRQYTAVMWSWVNGKWHRIDGARPAQAATKDTRGTKPAVEARTNDDILNALQQRIEYAEAHGHTVHYKVTLDGRMPSPPR